jgi:hypothetical protein
MNISPPSSVSKTKPRKNQHEAYSKHVLGFLLGLLFDLEDMGDMFVRNVG